MPMCVRGAVGGVNGVLAGRRRDGDAGEDIVHAHAAWPATVRRSGRSSLTVQAAVERFRTTVILAAICGLVGGGLAFGVSILLPKTYVASASLVVPSMADTFADVADSPSVLGGVVTGLHLTQSAETLAGHVS